MKTPREVDSPSSLSTFGDCPRRYQLDYAPGVDRYAQTSLEALLGTAVHHAAETLYRCEQVRPGVANRAVLEEHMLLEIDEALANPEIKVISPKTERTREWALEKAKDCLDKLFVYHDAHLAPLNPGYAIEKEVFFNAGDGWGLRGFVDLLVFTNEVITVIDFKTGARPYKGFRNSSVEKQLSIYCLALKSEFPDKALQMSALYLAPIDGQSQAYNGVFDEKAEEKARRYIARMREGLSTETDWRAKPGNLCRWCRWSGEMKDGKPVCPEGHKYVLF